ncbi:hypothetical protein [Haladaptatus sp. AB643]|uniref:hypothetical protein n=1 Tax=unclassified Haladaptatus TaxID=2622732 RepID=UPI00209C23D3|nr:hypothetical protein [Haladaptatus sp. AB643]MCO8244111.1 hypothetical protein [Haladaptatus sp. AB643]
MGNWLNLKLTGIGAMIFALVWALTNYSIHVSNPFLTQFAGVAAIGLAVFAVADALHGGLSD